MSIRLPSRYEDLDPAFRGRLRPNRELIVQIKRAVAAMEISGGIRFLPVYGRSGSGKSSAARELATHLPQAKVMELSRSAIISEQDLLSEVRAAYGMRNHPSLIIAIVDQYEENVADSASIPTKFIERLSLLDRGQLKDIPIIFLWLTTSQEFQQQLSNASRRNERILLSRDFELIGPARDEWGDIVEETFEFHNSNTPLADFQILRSDIDQIVDSGPTLGATIEEVGERLASHATQLSDLSTYQVVMLWPVTDGHRITRVSGFTKAREGYKLDWSAFHRELNEEDRRQLPLSELNRARLYFDVRLVPVAAADLYPLCRDLGNPNFTQSNSYLERFQKSHFFSVVNESWNPATYAPLRERESQRAQLARTWYDTEATAHPTEIGKRISMALNSLGLSSSYERTLTSPHGSVRSDICIERPGSQQSTCIVELKAFSTENTRPSSIKDAIRVTLKRHAQFAGFLARQ